MIYNCLFLKPTFYPKNIIMHIKLRIIFSFFIFNCIVVQAFAQNKYDNVWKLGYSGDNGKVKQGIYLDFKQDPPIALLDSLTVGYSFALASICNKEGDLICHSRGYWLEDVNGDTIPGSVNLVCHTDERLIPSILKHGTFGGTQSILMLPTPDNEENEFYVFNCLNDTLDTGYDDDMAYAKVSYQGAKITKVQEKCVKITNSKIFYSGYLSACRHGNGRDWWVTAIEYGFKKVHFFLFTRNGIVEDKSIDLNVGNIDTENDGVTCFSNDGNKVAFYCHSNGLWIYDFDRCNGTINNLRKITFDGETQEIFPNVGRGMASSPDSKYLYVSRSLYIYQFDMTAKDIAKSKTLIVEYDPKIDINFGTPNAFNQLQLAPNNKIYISLMSGEDFLHTIENPNEKGAACGFKRRSQYLPGLHAFALPNYPNFKLGAAKNSPCDTLSVANKELSLDSYQIKLFPNPASTDIKIDITLKEYDPTIKTEVVIVDVSGVIVQKYTMPDFAYLATIDISKLASGVYGVQLRTFGGQPKKFGERVLATQKLVVLR